MTVLSVPDRSYLWRSISQDDDIPAIFPVSSGEAGAAGKPGPACRVYMPPDFADFADLAARQAHRHRLMTPPPASILPAPGPEPRETRWGRLRRKSRTKALRLIDRSILALYRSASWLDPPRPDRARYFRVAIFGSSRIQPEDETYSRVSRSSPGGCPTWAATSSPAGGPGLMRAANEGAPRGRLPLQDPFFRPHHPPPPGGAAQPVPRRGGPAPHLLLAPPPVHPPPRLRGGGAGSARRSRP